MSGHALLQDAILTRREADSFGALQVRKRCSCYSARRPLLRRFVVYNSSHLFSASYAHPFTGVPLLAPNFGNPDAPAIPIGTLCVADDRPRDGFTPEQRSVLYVQR